MAAAIGARPRLKPILTRNKDYFVMLGQRQKIAEKFAADIFVSIHCNSAPSASARGAEVFFVSLKGAADKAAKELIDRENAADLVGGLAPDQVQGPISNIVLDLKSNATMRQSEQLGDIMLRQLGQLPGGESRGLKQGPLAVLKSIACPSVLVELGFVTNKHDARLLGDAGHPARYAELLAAGVDDYVRASG
jgi:N-acetylmuramoyl-L-alanine amidase